MSFVFTKTNLAKAKAFTKRYPAGREASAVLPVLDLAQRQNHGYLSNDAIQYVAKFLNMLPIRVQEVASFYTMFNLTPVGKHHVQICTTTPCWLRGSDGILNKCSEVLKINSAFLKGDKCTTADGNFTLNETECLGACIKGPVAQINDKYYENLTPDLIENILKELGASGTVAAPKAKRVKKA